MPDTKSAVALSEEYFPTDDAERRIDVKLWVWSLDSSEDVADRLASCLSSEETARAASFANARLRNCWVMARAGMRSILGSRLGVPPETISFSLGTHGKPYLVNTDHPCFFNLSHSEGMAVLAVGEVPVGVDIEHIGPLHEGVAEAFFSADESRALAAMPREDRVHAFYRCWTAKEALLKALGVGLSLSGKSFTVGFETHEDLRLLYADWQDADVSTWRLAGFEPVPGFTGAVAVQTSGLFRPLLHRWIFDPF